MNDPAAHGTTSQPENQTKRGRSKIYTDEEGLKTGFCVFCEQEFGDKKYHIENFHHCNLRDENKCYDSYPFKGRKIMAPKDVDLEKELDKCSECRGVFYKHRVKNHQCGNAQNLPRQECGDDSDEEGNLQEKTSRTGFCVKCAEEIRDAYQHKNNHDGYDRFRFKRRRILAPNDINLKTRLSKCKSCKGVFFKNEFQNHACKIVYEIDEGKREAYIFYCLLCQLRCESITKHWIEAHQFNKSYEIEDIEGIMTLLPKKTNKLADIEFRTDLSCGPACCLKFTYKSRVKRTCSSELEQPNE